MYFALVLASRRRCLKDQNLTEPIRPVVGGRPLYTRSSVVLTGQADSEIEIDVILDTIDSLAPAGKLVVKIDVEGHELQAVQGGAEALVARADVVLVESEERHATGAPQAVIDWFTAHGFAGWALLGMKLIPSAQFCTDVHQSPEDVSAVEAGRAAGPTYGNNFLFVRADAYDSAASRLIDAGFTTVSD